MQNEILKSPYDLVAEALETTPDTLNENSALGVHPNWDSFNHLNVIVSIEKYYHISIHNDDIMQYDNMGAIITLFKSKSEPTIGRSLMERIKDFFKK